AAPDFFMRPEILTRKGESQVRMGRGMLGIDSFEQAIELKPDYWAPYAQLADYYKDTGDRVKARETLERGLKAVPASKTLQQRLAELDAAPSPAETPTSAKRRAKHDSSAPQTAKDSSQ